MEHTKRLIFLAVLLFMGAACGSDEVKNNSGEPECEAGEIYNPVRGQCEPRSSNVVTRDAGNSGTDSGIRDVATDEDTGADPTPDMGSGDLPTTCEGTERRCNGNVVEMCVDGMFQMAQTCGDGLICERGNCIPEGNDMCTPGETRCTGNTTFQTCEADGMTWSNDAACQQGETCAGGECTTGCAGLIDEKSNVGCEYFTMRHNQATGLQVLPHTVVVSNVGDEDVTIEVTSPGGLNSGIPQQTIPPLDSAVLNFPTSPMVNQNGLTQDLYVIRSSRPVIATQFSPLNNPGLGSETSDASLLLPTNAVGKEYVVVGWRSLQPGGTYVDIVALKPDTQVTVTSPTPLSGGSSGNVPEGGTATFDIGESQVLHLSENRSFLDSGNRDVSGVTISATKPVAVYTGATIINVPDEPIRSNPPMGCTPSGDNNTCVGNDDCCSGMCGYSPPANKHHCMDAFPAGDHVEQQLFPVETWGTSYVATPFPSRSLNDFTIYRVVGGTDGTDVTLDPPLDGVSNFTLNRGEMRELRGTTAFELTATEPVMLAQFMIGGASSTSNNGDPAFLIPPAIEQYRDSYVFLVPSNYRVNNVTLVKQAGTQITLDGTMVAQSEFQALGGASGWEYAVVDSLSAGVHTADSSGAFGVVVHGMDDYISYAFAGGIVLPE